MIGTGKCFRQRRKEDPKFEEVYGEMMDKGILLPGLIVFAHVRKLIEKLGDEPLVVLDGAIRSVQQVRLFGGSKLLGKNDVVCHIYASYHTCYVRHTHRRKCQVESRNDDTAFRERYEIYRNSRLNVVSEARAIGVQIVEIDGDAPLEEIADSVIAQTIQK
jgi:adenylate kinase family enzyme